MLAPEFLQIWSCPDSQTCFLSPAPAAAPPCWPPEGPPLMGALPRAPRSRPKRKSSSSPSRLETTECFFWNFLAFTLQNVLASSATGSPSLLASNSSAKDVPGPYLPFPHPLRLCLLQAKQNMPRSPEEPTGNDPNTPTADPFQNWRGRGSRNMTAAAPNMTQGGRTGEI